MPVTLTTAEIVSAATAVAASLNAANRSDDGRLQEARRVFEFIRQQYLREVAAGPNVTRTTATGADAAAFFTAREIEDGDVYQLTSTADTEDDAHAAAKGDDLEADDVFQRVDDDVVYVGRQDDVVGLTEALAYVVDQ